MGTGQSSSTYERLLRTTRKCQSRHKLVIGNWNITSLRGKETKWSRKPNDHRGSNTVELDNGWKIFRHGSVAKRGWASGTIWGEAFF